MAFASKIDIIKNAEKELRLVYYIFDLDETTAYMTNALLEKIKSDNLNLSVCANNKVSFC